ncbi:MULTISPECIES: hypothetical protein [unclassified Burkholderia]|nr:MULTISPECIES: hypothetical protein [unclassified Burkholderia]
MLVLQPAFTEPSIGKNTMNPVKCRMTHDDFVPGVAPASTGD